MHTHTHPSTHTHTHTHREGFRLTLHELELPHARVWSHAADTHTHTRTHMTSTYYCTVPATLDQTYAHLPTHPTSIPFDAQIHKATTSS